MGFVCIGLMPLSYVLGEVLFDFRLLLWPFASCTAIVCLGIALYGNKFLIIKKKKNLHGLPIYNLDHLHIVVSH